MMDRRTFVQLLSVLLPAGAFAGSAAPALALSAERFGSNAPGIVDAVGRTVRVPRSLEPHSVLPLGIAAEQLVLAASPEHLHSLVSQGDVPKEELDLYPPAVRSLEHSSGVTIGQGGMRQLDAMEGVQLIVATFNAEYGSAQMCALEADAIEQAAGIPVLCLSVHIDDLPLTLRQAGVVFESRGLAETAARHIENALSELSQLARSVSDEQQKAALCLLGNTSAASFMPQLGGIPAFALADAKNAVLEPTFSETALKKAEAQADQIASDARTQGIDACTNARKEIAGAYSKIWEPSDGTLSVQPSLAMGADAGSMEFSPHRSVEASCIFGTANDLELLDFPFHADPWRSGLEQAPRYAIPQKPFAWLEASGGLMNVLGAQWVASMLYPDACPWSMDAAVREFFQAVFGAELSGQRVSTLLANTVSTS